MSLTRTHRDPRADWRPKVPDQPVALSLQAGEQTSRLPPPGPSPGSQPGREHHVRARGRDVLPPLEERVTPGAALRVRAPVGVGEERQDVGGAAPGLRVPPRAPTRSSSPARRAPGTTAGRGSHPRAPPVDRSPCLHRRSAGGGAPVGGTASHRCTEPACRPARPPGRGAPVVTVPSAAVTGATTCVEGVVWATRMPLATAMTVRTAAIDPACRGKSTEPARAPERLASRRSGRRGRQEPTRAGPPRTRHRRTAGCR